MSKHYKRGTMVFWAGKTKPWWVIEWDPDKGTGAYLIVDAQGEVRSEGPGNLALYPPKHRWVCFDRDTKDESWIWRASLKDS